MQTETQRKPHRQFCSLCHEVSRVDFNVPNDIWELAVHISQKENIICLRCFTRMADERGVEWDKNITFRPASQIAQDRVRARPEILDVPQFPEHRKHST